MSSSELTQKAAPQILSRSAVQLLSQGLDASDILECYALVRPAPLHNAMMSDATMTIHKVAIGLRYRPLTLNEEEEEKDKIREITLEYGPQRMGVSLSQESTPLVQHENNGGADINSTDTASSSAFVTWENEGKVYYTTQITNSGYISAYYMASVTGAVLEKILEKAVDYPLENIASRGRPRRYQPFVVVDGNTPLPPPGYEGDLPPKHKVLLKSSGSSDFVEYMWYTLAELGVSLQPILAPPTWEVQLVATGVEKLRVGPPSWVTQSAARFYENLYQCIEAKVTGDYSRYAKPTPAPTIVLPNTQQPTSQTDGPENNSSSNSTAASQQPDNQNTTQNNDGGRRLDGLVRTNELSRGLDSAGNFSNVTEEMLDSISPSAAPTSKADKKTDVEEAQIAASEAQQAAAEAKDAAKTDVDSKAADAAQVAATAAKKAADSSAQAAATAQAAALMSGDGASVTGVIAPCFTDPQFGIAQEGENGTITTHAYLYMDGSSYYKVNLTYPYVQIAQTELILAQPGDFAVAEGGGDFVDWALALFLIGLTIFGLLLLVQQVCGGYIKVTRSLFEYQRWFFNPLHYEDAQDERIEEEKIAAARQGGGQEYSFGLDVIPISMGGKRAPNAPYGLRNGTLSTRHSLFDRKKEWVPLTGSGAEQDDSDSSGYEDREIEMVTSSTAKAQPLTHRSSSRGSADSADSASSFSNPELTDGSSKDSRINEKELPSRFTRDPDLVDMPNLKSSSRVAIPVGVKRNISFDGGSSTGSGSLV